MKRYLLNILTLLSLLLCVAAVVMWVGSHRTVYVARVVVGESSLVAATMLRADPTPGRVVLEYTNEATSSPEGVAFEAIPIEGRPHISLWSAADERSGSVPGGFGYRFSDTPGTLFRAPVWSRAVIVPLWFVVALGMVPPVWGWAARRRRKRRAVGARCVGCGYDLRATAGRCPECERDGAADG